MGILKVYFVIYFKFIVIATTAGIFQKEKICPSLCGLQKAYFQKPYSPLSILSSSAQLQNIFQCLDNKVDCLVFHFMWKGSLIAKKGKISEVKCLLSYLTSSKMPLVIQEIAK